MSDREPISESGTITVEFFSVAIARKVPNHCSCNDIGCFSMIAAASAKMDADFRCPSAMITFDSASRFA